MRLIATAPYANGISNRPFHPIFTPPLTAAHRNATRCTKGAVDEAYFNLGLVLRAQERYQEALACFEKAIELTPDYEEAIDAQRDAKKVIAYLNVEPTKSVRRPNDHQ